MPKWVKVKCVETGETWKSAREACVEKVDLSEDIFRKKLKLNGVVCWNGQHYVRDDK